MKHKPKQRVNDALLLLVAFVASYLLGFAFGVSALVVMRAGAL